MTFVNSTFSHVLFAVLLLFAMACASETSEEVLDPKVAKLKLPDGFKAEHIYSPGDLDQGSWVAMTFE